MRVRELKEFLKGVDDEAVLVTTAFDHSYRDVIPDETTAFIGSNRGRYIYEDHGDDYKDDPKDKRIKVLVFS